MRIGGFARSEAAVTTPAKRWTDRATAGPSHGSETREAGGHHHTWDPAPLALEADGMIGELGPSPGSERRQKFEQLSRVDGTAPQLGIDRHEVRHGLGRVGKST